MNRLSKSQYYDEVDSLAKEALEDGRDHDEAMDWIHETIDGHQWVIYCAYNLEVIQHSDNAYAIEDCYDGEGYAQLMKDGGLSKLHSVMAYFAMHADVSQRLADLEEEDNAD